MTASPILERRASTGLGSTWLFTLAALGLAGCSPYSAGSRDYYGSVDPQAFPPAYSGNKGEIDPVPANIAGQPVGYYSFPLPPLQSGAADPLALSTSSVPRAYVFDPTPLSPFPDPPRCAVPAGYQYDQRTDAYRSDEQGNIFVTLPDAKAYLPLVAEVPVISAGETCQEVKSESGLLTHPQLQVPHEPHATGGTTDGKYLAWVIINPEATVANPDGSLPDASQPPYTGLGPQRWGWYDHYLLAYLDGGYVPTEMKTVPGTMGAPDTVVLRARAQRLYYPTTVVKKGKTVAGAPGQGYDVLQARRGEPGYSPLCQIFSYVPTDPSAPASDAAAIDSVANQVSDMGSYVYCLQLQ